MKSIRLLEDRVSRAAKRLRQLSEERKQLEEELRSLGRQAEDLVTKEGEPGPGPYVAGLSWFLISAGLMFYRLATAPLDAGTDET